MESEKQSKGAPDTTELGRAEIIDTRQWLHKLLNYYNTAKHEAEMVHGVLGTHANRIDRLERIYEKLYHEIELENIYLPRLTDVLIKYFPAMENYRKEIDIMMRIHKGFLERLENTMQEHFEYHSHTDKKTNKDYY